MFHGGEISEGGTVLGEGVEIDGDCKWDSTFVSSCVSFADGLGGVVYFGGDACFGEEGFYGGLSGGGYWCGGLGFGGRGGR